MSLLEQEIKQFLLLDEYFIKNITGEYVLYGKKEKILDILYKMNNTLIHTHDKYELIRYLYGEKSDYVFVFDIELNKGLMEAKHIYLHKYVGNNPEEVLNNFEYTKEALNLNIVKDVQLEYKMRSSPALDWAKEILAQWNLEQ